MTKIIIAVPNQTMYEQAQKVLSDLQVDAHVLKTTSETVVDDVLKAQNGDDAVVVVRGHHAQLLKKHMALPLVEITLSGQEIALLIKKACLVCTKARPHIAFIGYHSMFGDLSPFADIFDVDIQAYYANESLSIQSAVEQAVAAGANVIIGGKIAVEYAGRLPVSTLFLESTTESITMALRSALRVQYGINMEKKRYAQLLALLNYSFDAVLILDRVGRVTMTNYAAERIFHIPNKELLGKHIFDLLESGPGSILAEAIDKRKSIYSAIARTKQESFVVNMAAFRFDGADEGFILSMQAFKRIDELEEAVRLERMKFGYTASGVLDDIIGISTVMQETKREAMLYAQYDYPLLIAGDFGTQKVPFAQAIHNASPRRKGPFVCLNLAHITREMQQSKLNGLSGEHPLKGALELANRGTLLLEHVDLLNPESQYILLNLINNGCIMHPDGRIRLPVDVRLICTTHKDLRSLAQNDQFSLPLFYRLARLELHLPPLRAHTEDIALYIDKQLERLSHNYHKHITLSSGARALIHAHTWEGNELELRLFLEKLVILSEQLEITEDFVRHQLLGRSYNEEGAKVLPVAPVFENSEAAHLIALLRECGGNRAECARRLGISKTTLWRKMKKYHIES